MRLGSLPFFDRLAESRSVLLAGAGGGFDVFAAIPLACALRTPERRVHLANLSFSSLDVTDARRIGPSAFEVLPTSRGSDSYFPERVLARWLDSRGEPAVVYGFEKSGVGPLRQSYRALVDELDIDAVVLVDGGTDILMRGDEAALGSPEEDATSLAAVAGLDVPQRLVACLGFGIDASHGVSHGLFLENVASLINDRGFLGVFSLLEQMAEAEAYPDAVELAEACTPSRPSIVNAQIAAAIRGGFGDVRVTERTLGSRLFVSPLMAAYFTFDLAAVAARSLLVHGLEGTVTILDVGLRIEGLRRSLPKRERLGIPY